MGKLIDLTGKQFGRLIVKKRIESRKGQTRWLCECVCGKWTEVQSSSLMGGRTKSCGCLHNEISRNIIMEYNYEQNKCSRRNKSLEHVWSNFRQRCHNPQNPQFALYGGRGIQVCSEWDDSFLVFQEWAMHSGYRKGLTLDRGDNNAGYSPENCRWVDMKVQSNNQRKTIVLTYHGKRQPLSYWADELGISRMTLKGRYLRGWPIERILGEQVHKKNNQ